MEKNQFSSDLNTELLLSTLTKFKNGDFSVRMPEDGNGNNGKIARLKFNDTVKMVEEISKNLSVLLKSWVRTER